MADQVPNFLAVNVQDRVQADVTRLETNFDRIQAILEQLRTQGNLNASEINALTPSGEVSPTDATNVTVDRASFNQLLSQFEGVNAQELFDFIDGIDIDTGGSGEGRILTFTSDALSGIENDLNLRFIPAITISYQLQNPTNFQTVDLFINDRKIQGGKIPLVAGAQSLTFIMSDLDREFLIATAANEFVSTLVGVLPEGSEPPTVVSAPLFLNVPVLFNYLHSYAANDFAGIETAPVNSADRVQIANSTNLVTIATVTGSAGQYLAFAFPARLILRKLENVGLGLNNLVGQDAPELEEINGWFQDLNRQIDGLDHKTIAIGPVVAGCKFTYRATFI